MIFPPALVQRWIDCWWGCDRSKWTTHPLGRNPSNQLFHTGGHTWEISYNCRWGLQKDGYSYLRDDLRMGWEGWFAFHFRNATWVQRFISSLFIPMHVQSCVIWCKPSPDDVNSLPFSVYIEGQPVIFCNATIPNSAAARNNSAHSSRNSEQLQIIQLPLG